MNFREHFVYFELTGTYGYSPAEVIEPINDGSARPCFVSSLH